MLWKSHLRMQPTLNAGMYNIPILLVLSIKIPEKIENIFQILNPLLPTRTYEYWLVFHVETVIVQNLTFEIKRIARWKSNVAAWRQKSMFSFQNDIIYFGQQISAMELQNFYLGKHILYYFSYEKPIDKSLGQ